MDELPPLPALPTTPIAPANVGIMMRSYAAAAVAMERERAWYWCDFYAHAIDHSGNRYVRSNDALTAAHAVKSGTPAAAIRGA